MSGRRFSLSMSIAVLALVVAAAGFAAGADRATAGATKSPGSAQMHFNQSAPHSLQYSLASAVITSGGGTPYFVREAKLPLSGTGLFNFISFAGNGRIYGVCTSSVVGLQYRNNTNHTVDIWVENLDAPSYASGPWAPGGVGGESYGGSITWLVQVATGSGSTAKYASFIVTGFHDGPSSGCYLQFEGTATMGITVG